MLFEKEGGVLAGEGERQGGFLLDSHLAEIEPGLHKSPRNGQGQTGDLTKTGLGYPVAVPGASTFTSLRPSRKMGRWFFEQSGMN